MKYRWLVILACVFVTACNSSDNEEAMKDADKNTTAETKPEVTKPDETKAAETKPEKTNSAETLASEYKVAYDEFIKKIRTAKPADRAEAMKSNPIPEFSEEFRKLVSDNPDSEIRGTALAWLAVNSDQPEERASSLTTLMEKYTDSPAMKDAAVAIVSSGKPSQQAEDNLRSILENSPHREARGAAAHQLVSYFDRYKSLVDRVDELAENPRAVKSLGEEGLEYIRNLKVDDAEITTLYEMIVKDYSDVVVSMRGRDINIGDAASTALFEIRNLSMGCIAPDIEGTDLDGKEFALSDYRGKVVMLDFWGDW